MSVEDPLDGDKVICNISVTGAVLGWGCYSVVTATTEYQQPLFLVVGGILRTGPMWFSDLGKGSNSVQTTSTKI
jgi:hypothetical protein